MNAGNNSVQVLNSFSGICQQLAVTVKLSTGVNKYNFSLAQNSQTLQGSLLQNIIYQYNGNVTKDANGNTICPEAVSDSARIFIKLTNGSTLCVDGTPLVMFKRENVNVPIQAFADSTVDWQNSYIQLQAAADVADNGKVVEFFVNYTPKTGL